MSKKRCLLSCGWQNCGIFPPDRMWRWNWYNSFHHLIEFSYQPFKVRELCSDWLMVFPRVSSQLEKLIYISVYGWPKTFLAKDPKIRLRFSLELYHYCWDVQAQFYEVQRVGQGLSDSVVLMSTTWEWTILCHRELSCAPRMFSSVPGLVRSISSHFWQKPKILQTCQLSISSTGEKLFSIVKHFSSGESDAGE